MLREGVYGQHFKETSRDHLPETTALEEIKPSARDDLNERRPSSGSIESASNNGNNSLLKYRIMLRSLPEGSVRQKMNIDGISPVEISNFFQREIQSTRNDESNATSPNSSIISSKPTEPRQSQRKSISEQLSKLASIRRNSLSLASNESGDRRDSVSTCSETKSQRPPPPPPPLLPPKSSNTTPLPNTEKYMKMRNILPDEVIQHKMKQDGIPGDMIDEFFRTLPNVNTNANVNKDKEIDGNSSRPKQNLLRRNSSSSSSSSSRARDSSSLESEKNDAKKKNSLLSNANTSNKRNSISKSTTAMKSKADEKTSEKSSPSKPTAAAALTRPVSDSSSSFQIAGIRYNLPDRWDGDAGLVTAAEKARTAEGKEKRKDHAAKNRNNAIGDSNNEDISNEVLDGKYEEFTR
jgi:hypothetical protein